MPKETVQSRLDKLKEIAADALAGIQALERIAAAHTRQIGKLEEEHRLTELSIRTLADERINTQREWQAYRRRIPQQ